jgi:hypothetical protein
MTTMTELTVAELSDLYSKVSHDEDARRIVETELERRDRAAAAKRKAVQARRDDPVTNEWLDAAHAQYMQAEAECAGKLVKWGSVITDAWALWSGPEWLARQCATEELCNFWDDHPRIPTQTAWRDHQAGDVPPDEENQGREETVGIASEMGRAAGHVARDAGRVAGRAADIGARQAIYDQRRQQVTARAQEMAGQLHAQVAVRNPSAVAFTRPQLDAPALLRRTLEGMGLLYTDYVAFPSRSSVIAVTTWTGQAAARDADGESIWRAYVRLLLTSRENGSGKSTVADITRMLLQCRAGRMSKVTPYGLTKVLGVFKETAIVDDAQNTFRNDKAGTELLTIMINGYTPGATWVSGKGGDGKIEPASGPLMVVGKDALIKERAESLKDLINRSAVVRMERPDHYMPEFDEEGEARARSLGATLKAVTGALQGELRQAARDLAKENQGRLITDGDGGRTAQIWRPMLALTRVAGGPWYDATLEAMEDLSSAGGDLLKADEALTALEELRDDGRSFWDAVPGNPGPVTDDNYEEFSEEE